NPQIASNWTISDDGLIYTFEIRNDIYFHPHEVFGSKSDRLLTIDDIIASFELFCTPTKNGTESFAYGHYLKNSIKGAEEFFQKKAKNISGITQVGDRLKIELIQKDDNFLYKLALIQLSIHSKKIIEQEKLTDLIGTGPYVNSNQQKEQEYSLAKNRDYYQIDAEGYHLPYLDSVKFIIQHQKLAQLELFENQQVDMILALPTSKITRMVEGRLSDFNSTPPRLILDKNALLQTHYYLFNMQDPRFGDIRVRQAFNYAFNREKMGREVLKNQFDELGNFGITPPISQIFRGYDFNMVKHVGYEFNLAKAKQLLAQAGYPEGKGFGTVNLRYTIGDINSAVADEFSQQIYQNLGIIVNIDGSNFEQLISDAIAGK